jgi:tetratricopeptide (TPR) repeat protein
VPLKEQILVWDESGGRLAAEYNFLKEKITDYDVRGLDFLIKESTRAVGELDEERANAARSDLERDYGDRAESFYQIANAARAFGRLDEVESNLRRAIGLDAYFSPAFDDLVAFLKVKKRLKDAISICRQRLEALGDDTRREEIKDTVFLLGGISMAAGEYSTAVEAYEKLSQKTPHQDGEEYATRLANAFNYAEARRRAGLEVSKADLKEIIAIYETGAATEGSGSVVLRLNHMQAMHIPFALIGDGKKARQLLQLVRELVSAVSPRERIFSVVSYTEIPADQFLIQNNDMLDRLDAGSLWDGTSLPST